MRMEKQMNGEKQIRSRPYWHVDAKWVTGLLLVLVLSLTLVVYNLVQLTAEGPAIRLLSLVLATAFSPQGLDGETDIAVIQEFLQRRPDEEFQPIPGLQVTVQASEVQGLKPREMRLFFFRQLAEPLYQSGPDGLAELAEDPEMAEQMRDDVGLLGILSRANHQRLQRAFLVLGLLSLGLVVLLIFFSYRFGRLGSPGCALFFASLPGVLIFTLLGSALGDQPATPPAEVAGGIGANLSALAGEVLPVLVPPLLRTYWIVVVAGLGLMVIAGLGHLIGVMIGSRQGA